MAAPEPRPRLTCVTKRMPHHGAHAGYSAVLPHLHAERVLAVPSTGPSRWVGALTRRLRLGKPPGSDFWGAPSALAELRALARPLRGRQVVHLMYGEDLLGLSSYLKRGQVRVVATFHQPLSRIEALHVPRDVVSRLDALIALDEAVASAWRARHPDLSVHALRLAVDTDFWSPPPAGSRRARSCLVVGGHLRDLDLLAAALPRLAEAGVRIDLVGVPDAFAARVAGPGVRRHVKLTDEALRAMYREAGVFLLALRAASGNNALLQALATGAPVVSTDLPGVRSYVREPAARFVRPGDPEVAVDACLEVLEAPETAAEMSQAGLRSAAASALPVLAEEHWRVYASLFETTGSRL